jgi:hypothetical protein
MRHWITSFRLLTILPIYRRLPDCQSAGPVTLQSHGLALPMIECQAPGRVNIGPQRDFATSAGRKLRPHAAAVAGWVGRWSITLSTTPNSTAISAVRK